MILRIIINNDARSVRVADTGQIAPELPDRLFDLNWRSQTHTNNLENHSDFFWIFLGPGSIDSGFWFIY